MGVKRYVALAPPQVGGLLVGYLQQDFPHYRGNLTS